MGLLLSCTTAAKRLDNIETGASLYGTLYDTDSKPVSGCRVTLDGEKEKGSETVVSDINGRFFFDFVTYSDHHLAFQKEDYEAYTMDLDFLSKSQVVYARVVSRSSLIDAVSKAIGNRNWEEATRLLSRAKAIKAEEPLSGYLSAIIDFRQENYANAAELLERLVAQDYHEPYIYRFLGDIYENHLNSPEKALVNLDAFLKLREDADVRERAERLRGSLRGQDVPKSD